MVDALSPNERLFLDASFVVALLAPLDAYHLKAVELVKLMHASRVTAITTRAVLLEIANSLSRIRHRASALQYLKSAEADPGLSVVPLTDELWQDGFAMYQSRPDKEWGMTDCMSFAVMGQRGIRRALTADRHFQQAGFAALLLE